MEQINYQPVQPAVQFEPLVVPDYVQPFEQSQKASLQSEQDYLNQLRENRNILTANQKQQQENLKSLTTFSKTLAEQYTKFSLEKFKQDDANNFYDTLERLRQENRQLTVPDGTAAAPETPTTPAPETPTTGPVPLQVIEYDANRDASQKAQQAAEITQTNPDNSDVSAALIKTAPSTQYRSAKAVAYYYGKKFGPWFDMMMAKINPKNPAEYRAAVALIQKEFAKQVPQLANAPAGFINKYVLPDIDDTINRRESKFGTRYRYEQGQKNLDSALGEAQRQLDEAIVQGRDKGQPENRQIASELFGVLGSITDQNGNPLSREEQWRIINTRLRFKPGQLDNQLLPEPVGKFTTYGELYGPRLQEGSTNTAAAESRAQGLEAEQRNQTAIRNFEKARQQIGGANATPGALKELRDRVLADPDYDAATMGPLRNYIDGQIRDAERKSDENARITAAEQAPQISINDWLQLPPEARDRFRSKIRPDQRGEAQQWSLKDDDAWKASGTGVKAQVKALVFGRVSASAQQPPNDTILAKQRQIQDRVLARAAALLLAPGNTLSPAQALQEAYKEVRADFLKDPGIDGKGGYRINMAPTQRTLSARVRTLLSDAAEAKGLFNLPTSRLTAYFSTEEVTKLSAADIASGKVPVRYRILAQELGMTTRELINKLKSKYGVGGEIPESSVPFTGGAASAADRAKIRSMDIDFVPPTTLRRSVAASTLPTSTSTQAPQPSGNSGRFYSAKNYNSTYDLLIKAGATPEEARTLAAVAGPESAYDPSNSTIKSGLYAKTGERSFGLFQINMTGDLGPERRRKLGLSKDEDLLDPATNARAALYILRSQGLNAWTTYTDGKYKDYLP